MKYILLLPILFFANLASAQQTGEFEFQMILHDSVNATSDTVFIDIAQTTKKFAVNYREGKLEDRFVIDSVVQKVVELTNDSGEKIALVADLSKDEHFGITEAQYLAGEDMIEEENYRLTAEKKNIQGWDCQKIEFLFNGEVFGSGWVALGLYIGYGTEDAVFKVKEGTAIEQLMSDDKGFSLIVKLIKSSKTIANPTKAFSLEIPTGYELETNEDDYYDDEEEE
ncbi:MAG: hypothetical protein QE487_00905 [Fluviicola sp.]|nr:hypothetical protein [Fluviicola sp.]